MKLSLFFLSLICVLSTLGQLPKINKSGDSTDLTFTGSTINPYSVEYDTTGKLTFSGYIDTYYAYYTDTVNSSGFCKFPTTAPRNNQIGLNILQFSAKYESNNFRGTATIFGGDCPQSSWSTHLNFVQEANAGFRIVKKLWLDAGFFRTHFGLESIQPRENITMSTSTIDYFEPYFLSGLKLTWQHSKKLTLQLNAFNSFNQFIETNNSKALGLSVAFSPTEKIAATFSSIVCDESPAGFTYNKTRLYNDLYMTYKSNHWILGFEGNFGLQTNSLKSDSTKTAYQFSSLFVAKYRFTPTFANYVRGEIFTDPNEVLTGPIENQDHLLVGIDIIGITYGIEFKPIPNSYLRVETRYLQTKTNESIFFYNGSSQKHRYEFIVGLGVWF